MISNLGTTEERLFSREVERGIRFLETKGETNDAKRTENREQRKGEFVYVNCCPLIAE